MNAFLLSATMCLGQVNCPNWQCAGPIQTAAHSVVSYVGNVSTAVIQPVRVGLFPKLREVIQNRPRLVNNCKAVNNRRR